LRPSRHPPSPLSCRRRLDWIHFFFPCVQSCLGGFRLPRAPIAQNGVSVPIMRRLCSLAGHFPYLDLSGSLPAFPRDEVAGRWRQPRPPIRVRCVSEWGFPSPPPQPGSNKPPFVTSGRRGELRFKRPGTDCPALLRCPSVFSLIFLWEPSFFFQFSDYCM